MATNRGDRWFFVFGFEKSQRANIGDNDLMALRTLAHDLLRLSPEQLNDRVGNQSLWEICHHDKPHWEGQPDSGGGA
ncbi:type II toxin-antitoxin system RelE/ParE family toxin [Methylomagnum sp.]